MKIKIIFLNVALLMGVSAWANDVWNFNVYEDCSKNGYKAGYAPAPADVQAVDLGLPSGIRWASCNVGAESPEDYGNYYAWGEVLYKDDYSYTTYKYANGTSDEYPRLTKYCNNANFGDNGFTDNKTTLDPEDDAAHVNWGGTWRMPTTDEMRELANNCTWTGTTMNGINGYQVVSKVNNNSIFLPAVGYRYSTKPNNDLGIFGYYWALSLYEDRPCYAWCICFHSGYYAHIGYGNRWAGYAVRPVCLASASSSSSNYPALTLHTDGCESANVITCNVGQQMNITAIPDTYRCFTRWSDGNTDNPRLVTVTQDMTLTAEFAQSFSGQCGENLYWAYGNHTLTITGTGAMYDYNEDNLPWMLFRDTTDAIILPQGITHIGNNAFNGFVKLTRVDLPQTLTSIGTNAFAGCRKLYDIYAHPTEPPMADNTSFANYNVYLYVPCDNLRDYQMDAVFGAFKYIQCMNAAGTEQVQTDAIHHAAQKVFHDGQVLILRNGKMYITTGIEVK